MSGIEKLATMTIAVKDQEKALRVVHGEVRSQKEVDCVLASWFPTHVRKNGPRVVETPNFR